MASAYHPLSESARHEKVFPFHNNIAALFGGLTQTTARPENRGGDNMITTKTDGPGAMVKISCFGTFTRRSSDDSTYGHNQQFLVLHVHSIPI